MYKHYIRTLNSNIILGFSDAFQVPSDTDILIYEGEERHFHLNGILPLGLFKDNGCPNYKYIDEILILSSGDILLWETENLPTPIDPNLSVDERIDMNMLEIAILKGEVIP